MHATNILSLYRNKLTPFINRRKVFISKREVSLESLCFFIETGSFLYKNSYFLGLFFKKYNGRKNINKFLFNLSLYSFSKKPYAPVNYNFTEA